MTKSPIYRTMTKPTSKTVVSSVTQMKIRIQRRRTNVSMITIYSTEEATEPMETVTSIDLL